MLINVGVVDKSEDFGTFPMQLPHIYEDYFNHSYSDHFATDEVIVSVVLNSKKRSELENYRHLLNGREKYAHGHANTKYIANDSGLRNMFDLVVEDAVTEIEISKISKIGKKRVSMLEKWN